MSGQVTKRLFTVEDCYRMLRAGILRESDRLELIRGEILELMPIGLRQSAAVDGATRALVHLVGRKAIVRVQGMIVLDEFSAPQPDVALLRPRDDLYVSKHPGPSDILLVIEIADSSLEYDTTVKAALYAIMGIHEYWVADLQNNRVLCYSDPIKDHDSYKTIREFHRDDALAPQLLPDRRLKLRVLLP